MGEQARQLRSMAYRLGMSADERLELNLTAADIVAALEKKNEEVKKVFETFMKQPGILRKASIRDGYTFDFDAFNEFTDRMREVLS